MTILVFFLKAIQKLIEASKYELMISKPINEIWLIKGINIDFKYNSLLSIYSENL